MLTIDKTKVDEIIDGLFGNNNLTASPEVWYGLHQIKNLHATEVIRCSECTNFRDNGSAVGYCKKKAMYQYTDYFCGDAERRTDETD